MENKKARINEFDFMRVLCALGIAAVHFCSLIPDGVAHPFYYHANGILGAPLASVFFMVSGASLYYNHREINGKSEILKFWKKRFLSIYPIFWIAFLWFYIQTAVYARDPFFGGNPLKFGLTLLGIDGYTSLFISNYYMVGEWYLAVIIVLYFLYPFIVKCIRKNMLATWLVCAGLFVFVLIDKKIPVHDDFNPLTSLLLFVTGIVLIRFYEHWRKPVIFFPALVVLVILLFKKVPLHSSLSMYIISVCLFIVLADIGFYVMKIKTAGIVFKKLGKITMAVFLMQHKLAIWIAEMMLPYSTQTAVFLMLLSVAVSVIAGFVLYLATEKIKACAGRLFLKLKALKAKALKIKAVRT